MNERRLTGFLALSLGAHVAAFAAARGGARAETPVFEPPNQAVALAGDNFDVEPASEPPTVNADDLPPAEPETPERTPAPERMPMPTPASTSALARPASPPIFGAVGARLAADLATSFTRALPQVASADATWSSAPVGSRTSAVVTLTIDDDGHLVLHAFAGAPSVALRHGLERTLVLLGGREFTARAATTRLRVTARVSRDDVHDGLHGDVFALSGGSFAGDVGMAFFALPSAAGTGRRVDVELRLLP